MTIEIDCSRYGRSARTVIPLFEREREREVRVGELNREVGDDVPDRTARVASLSDDGRTAVLEFEGPAE